uniref:Uncharacterized protein n=1 Tax=Rhizophora mucronata TaxID=61149 RepID=A0A2P2P6K0_RHIMU
MKVYPCFYSTHSHKPFLLLP